MDLYGSVCQSGSTKRTIDLCDKHTCRSPNLKLYTHATKPRKIVELQTATRTQKPIKPKPESLNNAPNKPSTSKHSTPKPKWFDPYYKDPKGRDPEL